MREHVNQQVHMTTAHVPTQCHADSLTRKLVPVQEMKPSAS